MFVLQIKGIIINRFRLRLRQPKNRRQGHPQTTDIGTKLRKQVKITSIPYIVPIKGKKGILDIEHFFAVHDVDMLHTVAMQVFCNDTAGKRIFRRCQNRFGVECIQNISVHSNFEQTLQPEMPTERVSSGELVQEFPVFLVQRKMRRMVKLTKRGKLPGQFFRKNVLKKILRTKNGIGLRSGFRALMPNRQPLDGIKNAKCRIQKIMNGTHQHHLTFILKKTTLKKILRLGKTVKICPLYSRINIKYAIRTNENVQHFFQTLNKPHDNILFPVRKSQENSFQFFLFLYFPLKTPKIHRRDPKP